MIFEISKVPANPNYAGEEPASVLELDSRPGHTDFRILIPLP